MSLPIVDSVRALAKLHGWAIGEHGSLARDIDLIAVPWTADASPMSMLVSALCARLDLVTLDRRPELEELRDPVRFRPFGRRTLLLASPESVVVKVEHPDHRTFWYPPALDISFIDPREAPPGQSP